MTKVVSLKKEMERRKQESFMRVKLLHTCMQALAREEKDYLGFVNNRRFLGALQLVEDIRYSSHWGKDKDKEKPPCGLS